MALMDIIVINGRVINGRHSWTALDVNTKSNISIYTSQRLAEVLLQ
jgi:hypothetical protein